MLSYATPKTIARNNAQADEIMARHAADDGRTVEIANVIDQAVRAGNRKGLHETPHEFLKRIGYLRKDADY